MPREEASVWGPEEEEEEDTAGLAPDAKPPVLFRFGCGIPLGKNLVCVCVTICSSVTYDIHFSPTLFFFSCYNEQV